jgi:hypothetical protein
MYWVLCLIDTDIGLVSLELPLRVNVTMKKGQTLIPQSPLSVPVIGLVVSGVWEVAEVDLVTRNAVLLMQVHRLKHFKEAPHLAMGFLVHGVCGVMVTQHKVLDSVQPSHLLEAFCDAAHKHVSQNPQVVILVESSVESLDQKFVVLLRCRVIPCLGNEIVIEMRIRCVVIRCHG